MKLLICEDDISTINVLKSKINFSKYEIDIILEAYNGEMAIEIIKNENPELILCDIGMPKVNGIEVLKFARKNNKNVEFVFLTCYEDFKYVKLAFDYRACGYITKPFKLKQIDEALNRMVVNYKENTIIVNEDTQIKIDLLYSSVLKQISDGLFGTNKELIQHFLDNNGIDFNADKKFKIIYSCLNTIDTKNSDWSIDLLLFTAARVHDEILNNYIGSAHTTLANDNKFLWCITFVDANISNEELKKRCNILSEFCREHFLIEPTLLISNEFEFYNTYSVVNTLKEMLVKIRFCNGQIFLQDDNIDDFKSESIIDEHQLLWYLKNNDTSGYEEYIKSLLDNIEKANKLDQYRKEITMFFLTIMKDNNIPNSLIYTDSEINKYNNLENTKNNLLEYSKKLMNIYCENTNNYSDSEKIISKAKKFVNENYRENIDRDDIASITYVTPNYLSKLFRNSMGINLREYINQLRIEESKRLLLSTNMTVSEVASYVGYDNISYFSTVFHKLTGVSPSEWKTCGKEIK